MQGDRRGLGPPQNSPSQSGWPGGLGPGAQAASIRGGDDDAEPRNEKKEKEKKEDADHDEEEDHI